MVKSFRMDTFEKVKSYLDKQKEFIYKSNIAKDLQVNNDTLNLILGKLEIKTDEKGRVKL